MSASLPAINTKDRSLKMDVRASLRLLHSRRRRFQATTRCAVISMCATVALCLIAAVDYRWPLQRNARAILLSLILLPAFSLLTHAVWLLVRSLSLVDAAREIERAAGINHNAVVTMAESLEGASAEESRLYMLVRLESQARADLSEIDERAVAPREGAMVWTGALVSILLALLSLHLIAPLAFAREASRVLLLAADDSSTLAVSNTFSESNEGGAPVTIKEVRVRVLPPAYSGLSVEEVAAGDAPIRALSGSQVEVILTTGGATSGATLSFNGSQNSMRSLGAGQFSGTFIASESGAFEASVNAYEKLAPASVVRAVEVYNDAAPEARITEPQNDELLRSLPDAPVIVRWTASDDLGLASVALKYIKSRGIGDAAKFTNGEVGIGSIERQSAHEWRGTSALSLQHLDMQPGDTLVFWIEARDRNPSANNTGRSASLAIALAKPEPARLGLSDLMPNEIGRFLLSERQIIIHTEKLHSERTRLSPSELKKRANDIAAEQRDFKNSFNDYIKREGEAEETEANTQGGKTSLEEQVRTASEERTATHFHGIPEPPTGSPTSVKELIYAICAMWDAEDALTNADTALALKQEQEALVHLKRAQTAVRYIPPILPQSQPIDLKRRYAGELAEIKTRLERLARLPASKESAPVRAALSDAYAALNDLQASLTAPANARQSYVARASEKTRETADSLISMSAGDHAAAIAEAAGQLRIVESELARMDLNGSADEFAARLSKPLALLTQAASNLFAIAESRTRANGSDTGTLLPADDARAADYFRRLAGGGKR
ncbi:MAG: hypothetical protein DMF68_11130 [Acidobacteria bacterium]|nr:MAG: hypothetical protein DMF68_11130 [Acidobacteriota bacterium]